MKKKKKIYICLYILKRRKLINTIYMRVYVGYIYYYEKKYN